MWSALASLLKVQVVDAELWKLRAEIAREPGILADKDKAVASAEAKVKEAHDALTAAQRKADHRNLDLKEKEAEIRKLETQMLSAGSNKEYQVFQREVQGRKSDISNIEDEILALLDQAEALKKAESERKAELDGVRKDRDDARRVIEADLAVQRAELAELEARRAELVVGIDPESLRLYDRLLQSRDGMALAAVDKLVCQGCFVAQTRQAEAKLLQREKLQCANCQRLLYIPELWGGEVAG